MNRHMYPPGSLGEVYSQYGLRCYSCHNWVDIWYADGRPIRGLFPGSTCSECYFGLPGQLRRDGLEPVENEIGMVENLRQPHRRTSTIDWSKIVIQAHNYHSVSHLDYRPLTTGAQ